MAKPYAALERSLFGGTFQAIRTSLVSELDDSRRVLVLGEEAQRARRLPASPRRPERQRAAPQREQSAADDAALEPATSARGKLCCPLHGAQPSTARGAVRSPGAARAEADQRHACCVYVCVSAFAVLPLQAPHVCL